MFSARPDAANAPDAPLRARKIEISSESPSAPPDELTTLSSALLTTDAVSASAPWSRRYLLARVTRPCWPKRPSSVTPSRSAGNRDIIAKYVSVPAWSVISCARKFANARLRTPRRAGRPAPDEAPGASVTSLRLEATATPAAGAVAAGSEARDQDENRGDDRDDRGQAEHHADPVHERGEQDGDEDADHGASFRGDFADAPRGAVGHEVPSLSRR